MVKKMDSKKYKGISRQYFWNLCMYTGSQANHKTQLFWVKRVRLVPNGHALAQKALEKFGEEKMEEVLV